MICELGYMTAGGFRRNIFCEIEKLIPTFDKLRKNCNDTDLYASIFQSEDKSFNKKILAPLYFDLDGNMTLLGFEQTKLAAISLYLYLTNELRLYEHEIMIYFSGAKGFHFIIHIYHFKWK